eukprot:GHRR01007448.1.p1 GENE.GHRR01007448.1~~GHRR01007448.1.p1  ORF type:complete len:116 (+),score=20.50 GHRR01007448.1:84-431(+)
MALKVQHSSCQHHTVSCRNIALRPSMLPVVSRKCRQKLYMPMSADPDTEPSTSNIEDLESESARKMQEAERLRAAEKFMVIGSGTAECKGCGYSYSPDKGDPDFPIPRGVRFQVG